jgi:hypothetical protein
MSPISCTEKTREGGASRHDSPERRVRTGGREGRYLRLKIDVPRSPRHDYQRILQIRLPRLLFALPYLVETLSTNATCKVGMELFPLKARSAFQSRLYHW